MNPFDITCPAEEVLAEEEEVLQHPVVPRAERSIWLAPVYIPPEWTSTRPGADDHKAIATRGEHC